MKTGSLIVSLAVVGCSTAEQQKMNGFLASPTGKALVQGVEQTALAAANSAVQQYAATGNVKGEEIAKASLSSVGQQLRGLQTTEDAANPTAIQHAVKTGSASPGVTKKVAPAVANAVANAVQKGIPPDAANEAAAAGLDKAAAKP